MIQITNASILQGKGKITFPSAARRMDTLNDLLAASDVVSLHCAVTNETIQILNAECLQHIKPGNLIKYLITFLVVRIHIFFWFSV